MMLGGWLSRQQKQTGTRVGRTPSPHVRAKRPLEPGAIAAALAAAVAQGAGRPCAPVGPEGLPPAGLGVEVLAAGPGRVEARLVWGVATDAGRMRAEGTALGLTPVDAAVTRAALGHLAAGLLRRTAPALRRHGLDANPELA
jgi:hypothetical protein